MKPVLIMVLNRTIVNNSIINSNQSIPAPMTKQIKPLVPTQANTDIFQCKIKSKNSPRSTNRKLDLHVYINALSAAGLVNYQYKNCEKTFKVWNFQIFNLNSKFRNFPNFCAVVLLLYQIKTNIKNKWIRHLTLNHRSSSTK